MTQDIVPRQVYYRIFASLLVLTLLTVGLAFIDLGPLNTIIALTIAVGKATLVLLFFMHVRYSSHVIWVFVGAGVFWVGMLLVLTMSDYVTRGWLPVPGW
jgi:cytochrome c oxidase subunit IV